MKLLYCKQCKDIFRLWETTKTCQCGSTGGHYKDDRDHAICYGHAIPVGIRNDSFLQAITDQKEFGKGINFGAFVYPKNFPTIKYYQYQQDYYHDVGGFEDDDIEMESEQGVVPEIKNVFKDE